MMPNDGRRYGWDTDKNEWVVMPNDDRRYGWSKTSERWIQQPVSECDTYGNVWHFNVWDETLEA
jgi:hypothetical protein